jgi:death on curing protein
VTQYLLPEQVLFLHSRLIAETGGAHGVRDLGMLLSALGRPQTTFEDQELYPDLFTKTAAVMDSLVRNHPFVDGNEHTAIATAGIFLWTNHYRLVVENEEMVRFTLACAQAQLSLVEMTDWFKQHSSPAVE